MSRITSTARYRITTPRCTRQSARGTHALPTPCLPARPLTRPRNTHIPLSRVSQEATEAIKANFPKAYLYDDTPVHKALWRVATNCLAVKLRPKDGRYTWVPV